jgi:hypothetical protein
MARIYVGNLPLDIRTKDIDDLFYKYDSLLSHCQWTRAGGRSTSDRRGERQGCMTGLRLYTQAALFS